MPGGQPVFKGTRVSAKTLFDCLEESSLAEFLLGHPTVSRMQAKGLMEAGADEFSAYPGRTQFRATFGIPF